MFGRYFLYVWVVVTASMVWSCDDSDGQDEDTVGHEMDSTSDGIDTEEETDTTDENAKEDHDFGTDPTMVKYDGYEDMYIMTADDDPEDVCRVRFDLVAVAAPKEPCSICEWSVVVEKQNPTFIVNEGEACENSELALTSETIAEQVGMRMAYGFAQESVGHANILMRLNPKTGVWDELTLSNWDPLQSEFRYTRRDGMCSYSIDDGKAVSGICGMSGNATVIPDMNSTDETALR